MLLILVSNLTYSQRIRTIGNDTFVTFSREQAKAINDTFISQKHTINKMKIQDSLNISNIESYKYKDSIQRVKDSITYYEDILPLLNELKGMLIAQIETPFKSNIEIGAGAGLSTYFGDYRPFSTIIDGRYYLPAGGVNIRYNYHKHLTTRLEITGTQVSAGVINTQIILGTLMADYNIAPNMYSIRVGMIPNISIGYNIFGLTNESLVVGAGIRSYFTARTALEVNIRYGLTNIDNLNSSDHFVWGNISITRKLYSKR
jgi:hypothetical protein